MDVTSMLSEETKDDMGTHDMRRQSHPYPTRNTAPAISQTNFAKPSSPYPSRSIRGAGVGAATGSGYSRSSPAKKDQKHVVFQLIDTTDPRIQARLPMRVMISTHDTTDSIITTVKNFYGLYDYGVSFENKNGISMIAAYENFENDMTIYVRTVAQPPTIPNEHIRDYTSPKKPTLGAPFEMRAPQLNIAHSPSRSAAARSAGARSVSPQSDLGRRSASMVPGAKPRPLRTKSKDNSVTGDADGYSSGDNGEGSVTSSRRSKTELVNAEISVDNIVEGGRRKRAFESSELPLFVPPQVPMSASISSISPQRRNGPTNIASPYAFNNQRTFSYPQPLPSPQSYANGFSAPYQPPERQLRGRSNGTIYPSSNRRSNGGIIPTPDPTVGSAISDEDVAIQLMRLGDPTAFSHGRTSTSTVDDAFSGKADAASSDEEDEEEEESDKVERSRYSAHGRFSNGSAEPHRKKPRLKKEHGHDGTSGEDNDDHRDGSFTSGDEIHPEYDEHQIGQKPKMSRSIPKSAKPRALSMAKPKTKPINPFSAAPMSPSSMPAPSRKASAASTLNFQHQLGADEDDLSSKPRCQRCRKSKKGCDRQRPCGRCKDAGIGIEGCVSEDEGNGRKGRYGRHMGVVIKKGEDALPGTMDDLMAAPAVSQPVGVPANGYFLAPALPDKTKKRKR